MISSPCLFHTIRLERDSFFICLILSGYKPFDHSMAPANLALAGSTEMFANTIVSPCLLASPQCSSGLGGVFSAELHNGHIKDHSPGSYFSLLVSQHFICFDHKGPFAFGLCIIYL
jgi:hypothetical protein